MKRISDYLLYIIMVSSALFMGSCHHHHDDEATLFPGRAHLPVDRTIIFYMVGENSLSTYFRENGSQTSYYLQDMQEISSTMSYLPTDSRVVVYADDLLSSTIYAGDSYTALQPVCTFPYNVPSTDSLGMLTVLNQIVSLYPSNHYGLVMWSHASGWLFPEEDDASRSNVRRRSFGIDNGHRSISNEGVKMSIPTLANVLSQLPHLDFIFFDACFMQSIEVAYELRHVADYIVGSPAEIPGSGAPYDLITPLLCASPADLEGCINNYVEYYMNYTSYAGAELSMIRTDALDALAEATRPIVQQIYGGHKVPETYYVQYYTSYLRRNNYTENYDMMSLIFHNVSTEDYAPWYEAFKQAVPLSNLALRWTTSASTTPMRLNDPEHSGGVTLFVPNSHHEQMGWVDKYHQLQWYKAVGMDQTGW